LTWEWEWSGTEHGIAGPNVFPLRDSVVVTNKAIGAMSEVPPNSGVLTLTPVITCDEGVQELEPIVLTVGLNFVEPVVCCVGSSGSGPGNCEGGLLPDPENQRIIHLFLRNQDGVTWTHLGNSGALPEGRPLYLAYGVQRPDTYWETIASYYFTVGGYSRLGYFPPSTVTTGFIPVPDGVQSPGPTIPVRWLLWDEPVMQLRIYAEDSSVVPAVFTA
jgi:hypothetical protein